MTRDLVEFLRAQYKQRNTRMLSVLETYVSWLDVMDAHPNPHNYQRRRAQYWLGQMGPVLSALVEEFAGQPGYRDEWSQP